MGIQQDWHAEPGWTIPIWGSLGTSGYLACMVIDRKQQNEHKRVANLAISGGHRWWAKKMRILIKGNHNTQISFWQNVQECVWTSEVQVTPSSEIGNRLKKETWGFRYIKMDHHIKRLRQIRHLSWVQMIFHPFGSSPVMFPWSLSNGKIDIIWFICKYIHVCLERHVYIFGVYQHIHLVTYPKYPTSWAHTMPLQSVGKQMIRWPSKSPQVLEKNMTTWMGSHSLIFTLTPLKPFNLPCFTLKSLCFMVKSYFSCGSISNVWCKQDIFPFSLIFPKLYETHV